MQIKKSKDFSYAEIQSDNHYSRLRDKEKTNK